MNDHKTFAEVLRDEPVPNPERVRALIGSAVREESTAHGAKVKKEAGSFSVVWMYAALAAVALLSVFVLNHRENMSSTRDEPSPDAGGLEAHLAAEESAMIPEPRVETANEFLIRAVDCLRSAQPHEGISILILEGEPRFEYRHLKSEIFNWKDATTRTWLFSADPDFPQECSPGAEPILDFHTEYSDVSAWLRHDVIILGDVSNSALSEPVLRALQQAVAGHGRGLMFIAGRNHCSEMLGNPVLASLLPIQVRITCTDVPATAVALDPPMEPKIGRGAIWAAGKQWEGGAPSTFSWHVGSVIAHPGARLELTLGDAPMLVVGRAGFGRVAFAGGDEFWKLRSAGDGNQDGGLFDSLFAELAPFALRNRQSAPGHVEIVDSADKVRVGQPVRFAADARNGEGFQLAPTATLRRPGVNEEVPLSFTLKPELGCSVAEFVPGTPGEYVVTIQCDISGGMQQIPGNGEEAERLRWRTEVRRIFVSP